jgi:histidyl-tRNA synthetase
VFDVKSPAVQALLTEAPKIGEALCDRCREHFAAVRSYLDEYGVGYELAPTRVRGLDYYTRTVWEFVGPEEGAQSSISGGGRYDYLIEEIGGPPTPAVGFGGGIERLLLAMGPAEAEQVSIDVFFAFDALERRKELLPLIAELRRRGRLVDTDYAKRSVKGQLTQAQRLGARTTVVVRADGFTIRRRGEQDRDVERLEVGEL